MSIHTFTQWYLHNLTEVPNPELKPSCQHFLNNISFTDGHKIYEHTK